MDIAWDDDKCRTNIADRGLSFEIAEAVILSGRFVASPDTRRDYGELRWIGFGEVDSRLFNVIFTVREGAIRIISLRKANKREQAKWKKLWAR